MMSATFTQENFQMLKRNIALMATLVACLSTTVALAEGKPDGDGQRGPSPEMFQKMKAKMLENHQKRVQILQNTQSCIQAATAPDQLRSCHEQERQADEQLRQQNKQDREAMHEKMHGGRDREGDK
jgi:hypothetical protein